MPHINDASQNNVWEGNNGEKWIVDNLITSPDKIDITLKRLKVEEKLELIKEE